MGDNEYYINGHIQTRTGFELFAASLKRAAGDSWRPDMSGDGDISHADIVKALDYDRDGKLTSSDFLKNPSLVLHDDLIDLLLPKLVWEGFDDLRKVEQMRQTLSPSKYDGGTGWFNGVMARRGITSASALTEEQADFLTMAVLRNFNLLPLIPRRHQQAVWDRALEIVRKDGVSFERGRVATHAGLVRTLGESRINFTKRMRSLSAALTILKERASLGRMQDDRPVALLFYTTKDHNHAFETVPVIDRFVESGKFRVLYYEVSTEAEERAIRADVVKKTGRKIHTLVYGGHGSENSLALGEDRGLDPVRSNERYFIDTVDFDEGDFKELDSQIEEHGQVLLVACSNGEGGDEKENLTNRFADALGHKRKIYSSRVPTNMRSFGINEDKSLYVEWTEHSPYVARAPEGALPRWTPLFRSGFQAGAAALSYLGVKDEDASENSLFFNHAEGLRIWGGYRLANIVGLRASLDAQRVRTSNAPGTSDTMLGASAGGAIQMTSDFRGTRSPFMFSFTLPEIGFFHMMGQDMNGFSISTPGFQMGVALGDRLLLEGSARINCYIPFGAGDTGTLSGPQFTLGLTYHMGDVEWERSGKK